MSIPHMVHTSQTYVAPESIQQPSLMSGMSVPIQFSVGPSMSLTIIQPSVGLSMSLIVIQSVVGCIFVGGNSFVGPSFPAWG
jgi:hypothetical protein